MKKSISAQVRDAIIDDIFNNTYRAGQILTERTLIDVYGCSKTTVREALVTLCQEQILRNIPRYGYEVLRVERSEITDILEYRYVLETGSLRRCFDSISPRQILRLQECQRNFCESISGKGLWEHWDANARVHLELIQLTGNRYAYRELKDALDTLKRAYVQYYWDKPQQAFADADMDDHDALIDALKRRDLEAACSALGRDLLHFAY